MISVATATLGDVIPVFGLLMKRLSDGNQGQDPLPDVQV